MIDWAPTAKLDHLRLRARLLQKIRDFFAARNIMEVETPLLCHTSVTDAFIESIPAFWQAHPDAKEERYYLQTSPEYCMKRLLTGGSGSIYQITKAFRQGEVGKWHNPEFTILEWYHLDFNHHQLMDEMDALLQHVLNALPAERITYADLFQRFLNIDAHHATLHELSQCADAHQLNVAAEITDKDTWLNLLMTHHIEPQLGKDRPCFIYDFPASQSALARIEAKQPPVASRFEVYFHGIELANGFHELQDADEQRKRFQQNQLLRKQLGLVDIAIDEYLLAALSHGLPDCAGVALGVDRLFMIASQSENIADILSFDFSRV